MRVMPACFERDRLWFLSSVSPSSKISVPNPIPNRDLNQEEQREIRVEKQAGEPATLHGFLTWV